MSQTMKVLRCFGLLEYWDRIHALLSVVAVPRAARPAALKVFVSHEDPDFLSGCYEEVLGQLHDRRPSRLCPCIQNGMLCQWEDHRGRQGHGPGLCF